MADCCEACREVERVVACGWKGGKFVEIDGLSVFFPDARQGLRFEPQTLPQGGCAVRGAIVLRIAGRAGFSPWMDVRKLLPGQNWPRAIENAIDGSDFFIACYSSRSVRKRGGFQAEIRYALDCARQVPLEQIFLVPVRLDNCEVPRAVQAEFQWADLFPDWERGVAVLKAMMRREKEEEGEIAGAKSGLTSGVPGAMVDPCDWSFCLCSAHAASPRSTFGRNRNSLSRLRASFRTRIRMSRSGSI